MKTKRATVYQLFRLNGSLLERHEEWEYKTIEEAEEAADSDHDFSTLFIMPVRKTITYWED